MIRRLARLLTILVVLVACGDAAEPGTGPVASVGIVSGDLQIGQPGAELPKPLVVRVRDAEGNPVRGQVVNFRVVAGGGSVFAGSGSSNEDGLVQERWTLGPASADTQRVEARAVDPSTGDPIVFAIFRAVTTSDGGPGGEPVLGRVLFDNGGPPGTPEVTIGQNLSGPLWVLARDWDLKPVPNVELSFAVTGGGSIWSPTALTGEDGIAMIERWTIGPVPGLNTLIVSAPGFLPDTFEVMGVSRAALDLGPPAHDLPVDSMVQLAATRIDPIGDTMPNPPVQYRSLDPAVATVSSGGLVTGVGPGRTRIVATSDELADTVAVTVPMEFTAVSAGSQTTCAIRPDRQARCWGSDEFGQLGDGPGNSSGTASVPVSGGLSFREIGTSRNHGNNFSCGLTTGGKVYCWGSNSVGQLGTGGSSTDSPQPVVGGLTFTDLEVGGEHACAIATDAKTYCWGGNTHGQLGTGDSTSRAGPTAVAHHYVFTGLGVGITHTCGVTESGAAYCWGNGASGQLGQGTIDGNPTPVPVTGGLSFVAVTAGRDHTCGLTTGGAAYCWGDNFSTQLGNGSYDLNNDVLTPTVVTGGKTWSAISAGIITSCGITTDGSAWCWGYDNETLGDGSWGLPGHEASPVPVFGSHNFSSISIGSSTCAVSSGAGTPIFCWGRFPTLVTGF